MPTNADYRTITDNVMRLRSNCRRRTKSTVATVVNVTVIGQFHCKRAMGSV